MTYFAKLILTAAALAIAVPATAGEYKRIKTKQDYLNTVAGKKIKADWGWVIADPNGSISGKVNGKAASGKWSWKGGFWCRSLTFGGTVLPYDCLTIHVSGKNIVSVREKGKGKQSSAVMQ